VKAAAVLLVICSAYAQTGQPNVSNARFETRAFSGDLRSEIRAASPTWFGYAVKSARRDHQSCCWDGGNQCGCSLEGRSTVVIGSSSNGRLQLEKSDSEAILFRVEGNTVEKVRVFSFGCPLDAGGLPFIWLTGVPATASLSYLHGLVEADGSRHLTDEAIFAISQHEGPEALDILIRMAKADVSSHVRSQAVFWLAQKAGQRASSTIVNAIENDPDTEVKRQAVFALSQLPQNEGIPKLIEVARTQRNGEVRKQAFFWLGQSKDPRALAFIEDVLTK
jgi:HEAT repeats